MKGVSHSVISGQITEIYTMLVLFYFYYEETPTKRYKGVYFNEYRKKYVARCNDKNGIPRFGGSCGTALGAAKYANYLFKKYFKKNCVNKNVGNPLSPPEVRNLIFM